MKRNLLPVTVFLCLLCTAVQASAQSSGRYQAMLIQVGDPTARVFPKIFIFDTQNGDMWLWYQEAASEQAGPPRGVHTGPVRSNLLYQGKLRQGKEPGDLLHTNTIPAAK